MNSEGLVISPMIQVHRYTRENAAEWKAFLEASNNGTLFHDLDFLAYHPVGKFDECNLIFHAAGQLVALLPAAIVAGGGARRILRSPYGASVGGFVCQMGQSAETALALVACLQEHVSAAGLDGIEMRLPPSIYMREPDDHLGFALLVGGFRLVNRWLCHVIPLGGEPEQLMAKMTSGKKRDMRAGLRRGLVPCEASANRMGQFYQLLLSTQAKHGTTPTHCLDELEDLVQRVPGRLRVFLCNKGGQPLAGVLVLVLNSRVVHTMYICQDESSEAGLYPTTVLLAHVARQMASDGFRYLDLGPSSFDDMSLNRGLAFFKEGFGGRGFCRDAWRWDREQ